jgi:hypothetical protein
MSRDSARRPSLHPSPELRVYAAALDGESCPACAALAGLEYAASDPAAPAIPNPECTGAKGCRCRWL